MRVSSKTRSTPQPRRRASATYRMRPGVGVATFSSKASSSKSSWPSAPSPACPCSSDLMAFCMASSKVEPMAMTSPTAFMRVERRSEAPLNFSKAKRGIFTTQ